MSVNVLVREPPQRVTAPPTIFDIVTREGVAENLRTHGWTEIPWDPAWVQRQASKIKEDFCRMLESPHRDQFRYLKATEIDDQGLFEKSGERKAELTIREEAEKSTVYDSKWYFHCYDTTRGVLDAQGAPTQSYDRLFDASGNFNAMARRLAAEITGQLDVLNEHETDLSRKYKGSMCARVVGDRVVTRSAVYKSKEKGDTVAKLHRDRCAMTFHWISSHPGLVLYDRERRRIVANDADPGKLLIFLSDKLWAASRGKLGASILHGASNPADISNGEARCIVVTFVHARLTETDLQWAEHHKSDLVVDPADYPL